MIATHSHGFPHQGRGGVGAERSAGADARRAAARCRNTTTNPNVSTAIVTNGRIAKSHAFSGVMRAGYPHLHGRYSGTCESTMMRGSVISSIANRRPSRPKPDSFEPP